MNDHEDLIRSGWRERRVDVGGLTLHVVEAGRPGDPLLVLLHGFPEFWWAWRKQITPLAEAGFHVVVPDMRGYNESDVPSGIEAYALDRLAGDVVALADRYGASRIHLVGHDWGAVVAWWVAARHPERLHRLVVLNGPHPDTWAPQVVRHPGQAARSAYVAFFQLPWIPEAALGAFGHAGLHAAMRRSGRPDSFEPGAVARYEEAWAKPGRLTAMLNYYRALRLPRSGKPPNRIRPPALILWAGADRFLQRHMAEASLALCDDGRLEIVEGASHWLHLDEPDHVNGRIRDFLRAGS